ncbi:MAG: hypothetical protein P4L91_14845 [Burkholderiaceae bacterium]|nr:hypothetical protein [Burkholderiaceae bacterium]
MHMIHLKDVHVPKGPNLFALSLGELACCGIALLFFVVSWAVGGSENMENLGGSITLALLLAGMAIGILLSVFTRPRN